MTLVNPGVLTISIRIVSTYLRSPINGLSDGDGGSGGMINDGYGD